MERRRHSRLACLHFDVDPLSRFDPRVNRARLKRSRTRNFLKHLIPAHQFCPATSILQVQISGRKGYYLDGIELRQQNPPNHTMQCPVCRILRHTEYRYNGPLGRFIVHACPSHVVATLTCLTRYRLADSSNQTGGSGSRELKKEKKRTGSKMREVTKAIQAPLSQKSKTNEN